MTTQNAAYNSWETKWLTYLGHGGTITGVPLTGGPPDMIVNPTFTACFIRLCKSDPRSTIVYPNYFAAHGDRNSLFEPTVAEWDTYDAVLKNRFTNRWDITGNTMSNLVDIAFPAPTGGTGVTLTHAIWCLRSADGGSGLYHYGMLVAALDDRITIPAGGGGGAPTIAAGTLIFSME